MLHVSRILAPDGKEFFLAEVRSPTGCNRRIIKRGFTPATWFPVHTGEHTIAPSDNELLKLCAFAFARGYRIALNVPGLEYRDVHCLFRPIGGEYEELELGKEYLQAYVRLAIDDPIGHALVTVRVAGEQLAKSEQGTAAPVLV